MPFISATTVSLLSRLEIFFLLACGFADSCSHISHGCGKYRPSDFSFPNFLISVSRLSKFLFTNKINQFFSDFSEVLAVDVCLPYFYKITLPDKFS